MALKIVWNKVLGKQRFIILILLFCFVSLWLYHPSAGNSCNTFIHIPQDYFIGTGPITWLSLCQWSNPEEYDLILPQPTTKKHSKMQNCVLVKNSTLEWFLLKVYHGLWIFKSTGKATKILFLFMNRWPINKQKERKIDADILQSICLDHLPN